MRLIDADHLRTRVSGWTPYNQAEFSARYEFGVMIDHEPTVGGWISVKDRQPKDDGMYLAYIGGDNRRGYYKLLTFSTDKTKENTFLEPGYGWSDYDSDYGYYEVRRVTYWMPLPEPPQEVTGDAAEGNKW